MRKILMVCLGNICRSPIAEAVMNDKIFKAGLTEIWYTESAGLLNWHVGKPPDKRALRVMEKHGLTYNHTARLITSEDFFNSNYILGMDDGNIRDLKRIAPYKSTAQLLLLESTSIKNCLRAIMKDLNILFVCLGNTCRSPMAESVMLHWVKKNNLNWNVDSAGLREWSVGDEPEPRCRQVLGGAGLKTSHTGRMICAKDFETMNYILAMDDNNLKELQSLAGKSAKCKIELLGSYLENVENIQDPYFTHGTDAFHGNLLQITESCLKFIEVHKNE